MHIPKKSPNAFLQCRNKGRPVASDKSNCFSKYLRRDSICPTGVLPKGYPCED